jgi:hypothetical protein
VVIFPAELNEAFKNLGRVLFHNWEEMRSSFPESRVRTRRWALRGWGEGSISSDGSGRRLWIAAFERSGGKQHCGCPGGKSQAHAGGHSGSRVSDRVSRVCSIAAGNSP